MSINLSKYKKFFIALFTVYSVVVINLDRICVKFFPDVLKHPKPIGILLGGLGINEQGMSIYIRGRIVW